MPGSTFRGDPYRVLDVDPGATDEEIKRRWRDLAREHHPDLVHGDASDRERMTTRMARINAAYDLLRDPVRRARYDASPEAQRGRDAAGWTPPWRDHGAAGGATERPTGPPPPPPTRPVSARFDTSAAFLRRDTTTSEAGQVLHGHPPVDWRRSQEAHDLRASHPTGPVRRAMGDAPRPPSLEEARGTVLGFGRFHGWTLGEVAEREPTYLDWIASTITRDRDLVARARVIVADLDERGVTRHPRAPREDPGGPGGGHPGGDGSERRTHRAAGESEGRAWRRDGIQRGERDGQGEDARWDDLAGVSGTPDRSASVPGTADRAAG